MGVERWGEYLCIDFELRPEHPAISPTENLINEISVLLSSYLPEIERVLRRHGKAERATKDMWSKRFSINFGIPWEDSDKTYVGTFNEDGSIDKLDARTFLEKGLEEAIKDRDHKS